MAAEAVPAVFFCTLVILVAFVRDPRKLVAMMAGAALAAACTLTYLA